MKGGEGKKRTQAEKKKLSIHTKVLTTTPNSRHTSLARVKLDMETMRRRVEARKQCFARHKEYLLEKQKQDGVIWSNPTYWQMFFSSLEQFHSNSETSN